VPGDGHHHRIRRARRRHARRTTRYDIDLTKCIFCGFCEESCPVDSIVETHILEYHGEKRGDLYFTKDMLLAVGDRYEQEIASHVALTRPTDKASMDPITITFYVFGAITVLSALRVIAARNPVHSAICFWCSLSPRGAIWLLLQAEFLAITLVLVEAIRN
jgi:NAD-dependent dihydropyrimidine dehydrogenase PreA subunit/uncharacterized MnhB-related membrane protein